MKKKSKRRKPAVCEFPGCTGKPFAESSYCLGHEAVTHLADRGKRAAERGELLEGAFGMLGSHLLQKLMNDPRAQQFTRGPTQPPPQPKHNPFLVLGLDRKTATAADVRRVQRKLAAIYHSDKNESGIAKDKLAEINSAAAECLAVLAGGGVVG